jgi:hypothetical protein
MLTRDAILNADDARRELVRVPEWGGEVWVRGLTGAERDAYEADAFDARTREMDIARLLSNVRAKLVGRCMVDEAGARLFSDADIVALGGKSAVALQRVFEVAQRLSGITASDIEEMTKN